MKPLKLTFKSILNKFTRVFTLRAGRRAVSVVLAVVMVCSAFAVLSSLTFPQNTEAATTTSQTAYSSISEFQKNEFARIQTEIFGSSINNYYTYKDSDVSQVTPATPSAVADVVANATTINDNDYFTWTDTSGISAVSSSGETTNVEALRYTGGTTTVTADTDAKTITTTKNNGDKITVKCTTYYVHTGNEFRWALEKTPNGGFSNVIRVVLMNDIDLGGEYGQNWSPIGGQEKYLYIEGNGHTIYNFYSGGEGLIGLFGRSPKHFVVKNLAFKSTMLLQTKYTASGSASDAGDQIGLLGAWGGADCYLYNVHSTIAYVQTDGGNGAGGLLGRNILGNGNYGGDIFIENCSTSKYIMYGKDHIGGLTSYYGILGYASSSTSGFVYSQDMPTDPMYYVFGETKNNSYPIMIKNTYSVDCTIFSTGADSGAFISCGDSIWAKNCFTNNTIYAKDNTGGFIGRTANNGSTFPMHDDDDNATIGCYFENCYSTGIVEGKSAMGGFIGVDMGCHSKQTEIQNRSSLNATHCNVYKNCYSTAMVGMDYAGKYCGGFIGYDDNDLGLNGSNKKATIKTGYKTDGTASTGVGSWYINCYAAGEVGNILTITDVESAKKDEYDFFTDSSKFGATLSATDTLDYYPTGGFVGAMCLKNSSNKCSYQGYKTDATSASGGCGNFYNCYYDMQTSAMEEMAVGLKAYSVSNGGGGTTTYSSFDSSDSSTWFKLSGVTGVYTEKSTVKNNGSGVLGLTDFASTADSTTATGSMLSGDTSTWSYTDEYYPQLSVFMAGDTKLESLTDAKADDITEADKKSEFYVEDSEDRGDDINAANYSKPVLSIGGDGSTNTYAAQLGAIIMAYRYSQASTATVLLDHWDYIMDTTTGQTYDTEAAWVGSANNRLTRFYIYEGDSDTDKADVYAVAKYYKINDNTLTEVDLASLADIIKIVNVTSYTSAVKYETGNTVYAVYNPKSKSYKLPSKSDTSPDAYDDFSGTDIGEDISLAFEDLAEEKGIDASDIIAEWRITYEDRDAADLQFKIKEGVNSSQAYNYGETGFNSTTNLTVKIPYDECDVTIRFREGDISASSNTGKSFGFYAKADYECDTDTTSDPKADSYGNVLDTFEEANESSGIYVRGGFPETSKWEAKYEMVAQGNNVYTYTFEAGTLYKGETYSFKIADDSWTNINYGPSGEYNSSTNMSFTVKGEKDGTTNDDSITITFTNDSYHMTSVSGDISDSYVGDKPIDFDGYSLIASNARITGYKWLQSGYLLAAAQAGELKDEDGDGTYTKSFTVTKGETNVPYDDGNNTEYKEVTGEDQTTFNSTFFETTLAYKVIEDGVDEGANKYFVLHPTSTSDVESFILTFNYIPGTATTTATTTVSVVFKYSDGSTESSENSSSCLSNEPNCESYHVLGDEGLTGANWAKTNNSAMIPDKDNGNIYTLTYKNISAGTYGFKVVGDGTWTTGVDYGNSDGGNFSLKLSGTATSVTIMFNKSTGVVSVEVDPDEYYDRVKYVVTGTGNLMGDSWDKSKAVMTFNSTDSLYHYTIENVTPNQNYAFKVIEQNNDQGESNITFYIAYDENVNVEVIYNAATKATSYEVYTRDPNTDANLELLASSSEPDEIIKDTQTTFWSVLGDTNLTGYNWGSDTATKAAAAEAGKMEDYTTVGEYYSEGEECYVKKYENITVSATAVSTYSFKIAANGDWDTGISYGVGGLNGDNETISLSAKGIKDYDTLADVTIYFNRTRANDTTGDYKDDDGIYIVVSPDGYDATVDANVLDWVLVGETDLTKASTKTPGGSDVYDTVRDITAAFKFTSGRSSVQRGVTWASDSTLNDSYGFLGTVDYSLDYTVETIKSTAEITQKVVDLSVVATADDESGYSGYESILGSDYVSRVTAEGLNYIADYTVSNFAPGKQWLTIQTNGYGFSEDYRKWKFSTVGYNEYQEALESYNNIKEVYVNVLKGYQYSPENNGKYVDVDEKNIDEYVAYLRTNASSDSDIKAIYSSLLTYGDLYAAKDTLNNLQTYYNALVNAITAMSNASSNETDKAAIESYYNTLSTYIGSYLDLADTSASTDDTEAAANAAAAIEEIKTVCTNLNTYISKYVTAEDEFKVADYTIHNPTLDDQLYVGSRSLRLIPTATVEAGVDEQVNVVQTDGINNDDYTADNFVKIESDTKSDDDEEAVSKIVVTNSDNTSATTNTYTRYNFALTAGYLATDKIGLGIYDNYSGQGAGEAVTDGANGIQLYNEDEIRNYDTYSERTIDVFFAMSSTFTQSASYTDDNNGSNNLSVESMVEQDLIGPTLWDKTYQTDSEGNTTGEKANLAKTIVKVYKQASDGTYSKVIMDSSSTEYTANINKWTGQAAFTSTDTGTYRVQFSWAMADGRYITDSKYVTITAIDAGLKKNIVEEDEDGEITTLVSSTSVSAGNNTITYDLSYTSDRAENSLHFALLDVLPYNKDSRKARGVSDSDKSTEVDAGSDFSFTLKSIKIIQTGGATISGLYYTTSKNVQNYVLNSSSDNYRNAADNLDIGDQGFISSDVVTQDGWTQASDDAGKDAYTYKGGITYNINAEGVTGIALTGTQLNSGNSIEIQFTVECNLKVNDYLVNNAFYQIKSTEDQTVAKSDYSKSVTVAAVSRKVSGYVWYDSDGDGKVDERENMLKNVKVGLYNPNTSELLQKDGSPYYVTTDESGYYEFEDVPPSTYYQVRFYDNGDITAYDNGSIAQDTNGADLTYKFNELINSTRLYEASVDDLVDSRSLAYRAANDKDVTEYYFINSFVTNYTPTNAQVVSNYLADKVNTSVTGYLFEKSYQNLGLVKDYGKPSAVITKVGYDNATPLVGVVFTLEYYSVSDEKWYAVYKASESAESYTYSKVSIDEVKSNTDGTYDNVVYKYTTDSDGKIYFDEMNRYKYRITEIKSNKFYALLSKPYEFELPYGTAVDPETAADSGIELRYNSSGERTDDADVYMSSTAGNVISESDGTYYYRKVGLTVSNSIQSQFNIPSTGGITGMWFMWISFGILAVSVTFIIYSRRRKKSKVSDLV